MGQEARVLFISFCQSFLLTTHGEHDSEHCTFRSDLVSLTAWLPCPESIAHRLVHPLLGTCGGFPVFVLKLSMSL